MTSEEARDLQTLAEAHAITGCKLGLVLVNESDHAGAAKKWFHVAISSGSLRPCQLLRLPLCQEFPDLPKVQIKQVDAPAVAETVVLRVTTDQQYIEKEAWKRALTKPLLPTSRFAEL